MQAYPMYIVDCSENIIISGAEAMTQSVKCLLQKNMNQSVIPPEPSHIKAHVYSST